MSPPPAPPGTDDAPAADAAPAAAPSLFATFVEPLLALVRELPALVSDRVELLTLELQRAGRALAQIVALVVAIAVLGVTLWLLLWVAVAGLLVAAGLSPPLALALIVLVNALAIVVALSRVKRLVPQLQLPATRRHLTLTPSPDPRHPDPDDERTARPAAVAPAAARQPAAP